MDDMQIKPFDKDTDYDEISEWFTKRNLKSPTREMLSHNGVIIPHVACGFLYLTDSSLGFLDYYISNPMAQEKKRAKALEMITMNLMMWAKEMGISHLIANSQVKSIQKLALSNDFKSYGFSQVFMKEL